MVRGRLESKSSRPVELVGRTIVGLPVVLWRTETGEAVALEGRCCHKRMPLAAGKLLADGTLECAYHGLCFDTDRPVRQDPDAAEPADPEVAPRCARIR